MKISTFVRTVVVLISLPHSALCADAVPRFSDVAKDQSGKVQLMNQQDSAHYCLQIGAHLPSAREYAKLSQSLGAHGILETGFPGVSIKDPKIQNEMMNLPTYSAIFTTNAAHEITVDFYFDEQNYRPPAEDLGPSLFWTSTANAVDSKFSYFYSSTSGIPYTNMKNETKLAVRCAYANVGPQDLLYFGGPVISHALVFSVMWSDQVAPALGNGRDDYFGTILDSPYMDWLSEYNTDRQSVDGRPGSNQKIFRGKSGGAITINPTATGNNVSDDDIKKELEIQIKKGVLPLPTADTIFMIYFPPTVLLNGGSNWPGLNTCNAFGGYHTGFVSSSSPGIPIHYAVIPDRTPCHLTKPLDPHYYDYVSSHEMIESITNPNMDTMAILLDFSILSWVTLDNGQEIADFCADLPAVVTGANGHSYTVQKIWSVMRQRCVSGLND